MKPFREMDVLGLGLKLIELRGYKDIVMVEFRHFVLVGSKQTPVSLEFL